MSTAETKESWDAWTARIASEFASLADHDWLAFTVATDGADAFIQGRLLEGVIALECIADTEFEGLTDLTRAQQRALTSLGWEREGSGPDFSRTFPVDEAAAAAGLVAASLRDVLGADSPDGVEVRQAG